MSNLKPRKDYIESSGADSTPIPLMVPLNRGAADTHLNATSQIVIPHLPLVATPFASGGGDQYTIPVGRFQNKKVGGGTRNQIYGSARYGSGYGRYTTDANGTSYEAELNLNIAGRDFPFGYPPISWGPYGGGKEYEWFPAEDVPGVAFIDSIYLDPYHANNPQNYGAMAANKGNQTWFIVADAATINILWEVLLLPEDKGGCNLDRDRSRKGTVGYGFGSDLDDERLWYFITTGISDPLRYPIELKPWNVVQYYRASSVILANNTYDNTFAHFASPNNITDGRLNNTDYWAASPLNTTGVDLDYLKCLNTTIAAAIPIINPNLVIRSRLAPGQIAGIAVGSVVGGLVLIALAVWLFIRHRRAHPNTVHGTAEVPPSESSTAHDPKAAT